MAHILVIDDDPTIQRVLAKALSAEGHQVEVTDNGRSGVELAQSSHPALIICDWVMPGSIDGLEVCRQVKATDRLSTTFFILLTSRNSLEDRVLGLDTGADDFLAKPIEMSELHARIRAGLRIYQLTNDLQQQKQLLESELAEASDYVKSLLPRSLTLPLPIETTFIPSRQLGGDCFDYFWLESGELVIFLLDMSGHGLGAALPSVSILNLLRSQSLAELQFSQPQQVLNTLNRVFQMSEQGDKYFTVWYGFYTPRTRELKYASAGHPPALLAIPHAQDVSIESLRTKGLPIGLFPDSIYQQNATWVPEGSSLYVFSDGVYELLQDDGQVWGLPNFMEVLRSLHRRGKPSLTDIQEILEAQNHGSLFQDDISLIKVQF